MRDEESIRNCFYSTWCKFIYEESSCTSTEYMPASSSQSGTGSSVESVLVHVTAHPNQQR